MNVIKMYFSTFIEDFEQLQYELSSFGYAVNIELKDDLTTPEVQFNITSSDKYMPEMVMYSEMVDETTLILSTVLTFPELDSSLMGYYDDIEYHLKRWAKLGSLLKEISRIEISLDSDEYE